MGSGRSDALLLAKDELGALSPNRGVKSGVPGGVREVESVDLRPESGRRRWGDVSLPADGAKRGGTRAGSSP